MGGPSNIFEVETFLKNMFYDEHILRIKSNFLRKMIGSFIVNRRLSEAQENYKAIGGKSPIVSLTFSLIEKLNKLDPEVFYTYAMRYTPPYAQTVALYLKQENFKEVTLLSLYPQYSTTTTLSSITDFKQACEKINFSPKLTIIDRFYQHPLFLQCIKEKIQETLLQVAQDPKDYILILSAHSLPQSIIDSGDPYQKECEENSQLLKNFLANHNIHFKDILLTYQSKLGPIKWISPYTKETVKKLANQKIIIYPIAFSIDNSETHFELEVELRQEANQIGMESFLVCPCPNNSDTFAELILDLAQRKKQ